MNLGQLAAIGEFVGGIVVVLSVFYVALQVRQGSTHLAHAVQSLRTTTFQYVTENFNEYRSFLLNKDVADVWIRGLDDLQSLTAPERLQFNMVASSYIWTAYYFRQLNKNEGLLEDLNSHLHIDMFKHPGFRRWFEGYAMTIDDEYRDYLQQLCEVAEGHPDYQPNEVSNLLQGSLS